MKFKVLNIQDDRPWYKRFLSSRHTWRTLLFVLIGSGVSFLLFFLSEGRYLEKLSSGDVFESLLIGGLFGLFITNSPCARGRC